MNHHPYLFIQAFDRSEQYVAYLSERSGREEVYRVDVDTGETVQLTDRDEPAPLGDAPFDRNKPNQFLYPRNSASIAVDLITLEETLIADIGDAGNIHEHVFFSGDRSQVTFSYIEPKGTHVVTAGPLLGSQWPELYKLPTEICYTQFCPGDASLITFARDSTSDPTASPEARARNWFANPETGEYGPYYVPPLGKKVTHEYWSQDGGRFYCQQYNWGENPHCTIGYVPRGESEFVQIAESDEFMYCHSFVNTDETRIVSDHIADEENRLFLFDTATGSREDLCSVTTLWKDQRCHAHPNFSPSGSKVLFTSVVDGLAQVHMLRLDE
jgi:hypothetical protein